ncbi:fructosamine kinase family protein [Winogradskyella sp. DF17]|uniref:Fructosamine kinase family protein n=1 Tax=Winogradskyella pelagia TaxID=2819984 RepID=A0ABS3SZZ3_9FLAO|nr:fructosamine kinase family protein [Winogradskyella sp. DF17]MBO3116058.1 fructosamine kinase family protein [Winogradskyella sp. DF17]
MEVLVSHIESIINTSIINSSHLSGGDTASVLKLDTVYKSYVLKYSPRTIAQDMFKAEVNGIRLIAKTNTIATPLVLDCGTQQGMAYILMEYVASKPASKNDYAKLGSQLAKLHNYTGEDYGLASDNFIGSLSQKNNFTDDWIEFYGTYRLEFQLKMAYNNRLLKASEIPSSLNIKSVLKIFCDDIKPSLLHGDLWSGNFLISEDNTPYLIDPAAYYGHSEVDIAMSKLFGGFNSSFYESYHEHYPVTKFFNERIDVYQLYYLLVHLNLFGSSYYGAVKRILRAYF